MPNFYVYGPSHMSVEQINNTTGWDYKGPGKFAPWENIYP
jgi:hypothetical protein